MSYVRKTKDEIEIQQFFPGTGWECVCGAENWAQERQTAKEYRENQPEYRCRIKVVRVKI